MDIGLQVALSVGAGKDYTMAGKVSTAEALLNRAFDIVSREVQLEIRSYVKHLNQVHGNKLVFATIGSVWSVSVASDLEQVLLIKFDALDRTIKFEKTSDPTVNYSMRVQRVVNNKAVLTHRKYDVELGTLDNAALTDVVRNTINYITDLPQPIA
jgi:hypothetical protein